MNLGAIATFIVNVEVHTANTGWQRDPQRTARSRYRSKFSYTRRVAGPRLGLDVVSW